MMRMQSSTLVEALKSHDNARGEEHHRLDIADYPSSTIEQRSHGSTCGVRPQHSNSSSEGAGQSSMRSYSGMAQVVCYYSMDHGRENLNRRYFLDADEAGLCPSINGEI